MKKELIIVFFAALATTLTVYWKIPVKGLIPFPGDLLVGRFYPFNSMQWEGYPLGVPYKEFINADVVRQLYPWRDLSISLMKHGELPVWNPFAFSGSPLLANLQSAPFYPLNLLYWLTDHHSAWIIGVILQPVLALLFMWLLMRELKVSKAAAALASLAFAFSGYMVIWWELNTVGHAALWLPFILWAIERLLTSGRKIYAVAVFFACLSSLLAGHLQTAGYVLLLSVGFAVFRLLTSGKPSRRGPLMITLSMSLLAAFFVSLVQIKPGLDLLSYTPRGTQSDEEIFSYFILPPRQLMTFFAHDFFGNPATKNFWGVDYGEFMGYFGVTALFFALGAVAQVRDKSRMVKFFAGTGALALLFALPTPLPHFIRMLDIPVFSTSAPSRILFLVQSCAAILAGFGLDYWLKKPKTFAVFPAALILFVYAVIGGTAIYFARSSDNVTSTNWGVTLRNLVIPTTIIGFLFFLTFLRTEMGKRGMRSLKIRKNFFEQTKLLSSNWEKVSMILVTVVAIVEYSYFANKFQTFSEARFFFPQSPPFSFLEQQSQEVPYRFFGDYTSSVMSNAWIPYEIYGVEGYDSLYLRRYGELLAASRDGNIPENIPRSDANLIANQDDFRRRRLQDLLGVRYILDKNDDPHGDWEPDPHTFPPDRYQLRWQDGKFKAYENTSSLARAYLVGEYEVIHDDQAILDRLFSPDFDPKVRLILEEAISEQIFPSEGNVSFLSYTPNRVMLAVETPTPQLLFLSDAYYPDWQATIDGREAKILRADYAFRAVVVPPGNHEVAFDYLLKYF